MNEKEKDRKKAEIAEVLQVVAEALLSKDDAKEKLHNLENENKVLRAALGIALHPIVKERLFVDPVFRPSSVVNYLRHYGHREGSLPSQIEQLEMDRIRDAINAIIKELMAEIAKDFRIDLNSKEE